MRSVDNFNLIKSHLEFNSSPGDFYFLEIIKRRKENPDLTNGERIIRDFTISSEQEYDSLRDKICSLCIENNARAYLRLNRRNFYDIGHRIIHYTNDMIRTKDHNAIKAIGSVFYKMAGSYHVETNKTWIIDIDFLEYNFGEMLLIRNTIEQLYIDFNHKNIKFFEIPTVNGIHLIVSPFNLAEFRKRLPIVKITVYKDNPTLLFYKNKND